MIRLLFSRFKPNHYKVEVHLDTTLWEELSVYEDYLIEERAIELCDLITSILDTYVEEKEE